ncbi:MAG: DUF4342 domain-containing protein [Chromatiaceae bacterium]|nr:MAG: DUF4342 domain-containing protein [Chromatiaceae bacterium]
MKEHRTGREITERVSVVGGEVVSYVKQLVAEGNVRRLILRKPDGGRLLEIPLTAGVAVGGALTLFMPALAAIAAIGALVAKVELDIIHDHPSDPPDLS